ncbi:Nucleolar protein 16 [Frankliniella fusca]|uniref:Nucleolar protein 16 n=1 Tax=Frankliniella fusca TaxID=407009 RepID=A0AAE1LEG0_9NEOP|nr:Nucleolar protein 16 [Frankliniella fusca]
MGKTKRQRKNKKFRYNVNRKRVGKNRKNTGTAAVGVPIVKKAWEEHKSIKENLSNMGLSYDPNATLKIPTSKELLEPVFSEDKRENTSDIELLAPIKAHVAEELEAEAKAPRVKKFELPKGQVMYLSYLIDKYGDDFKAMARDSKNIYQETWKQIRSKIRTFQNIPSQWDAYLESRSDAQKT